MSQEHEKKIEFLEMQVKHLTNELRLTKVEYEKTADNYFNIYSHMERKVQERTKSLKEEIVKREAAENELTELNYQLQELNLELEQRVKERTEDLRKAKQMAEAANLTKSEFLANVSHEIRTPMNAIMGFTEIIATKVDDEMILEYLKSIKSSGKTLLTLINDIIDLSKVEAGKMELNIQKINFLNLLNEVEQFFAYKIQEKGLQFIYNVDEAIPRYVLIDEIRMRQILINLIGNAVKFTDHGYIKVSFFKIGENLENNTVDLEFSVEDTGIGIPLEENENIFEPFKQQTGQDVNKYGGAGLGLTVTKRLVEIMKGDISLESQSGHGCKFTVCLCGIEEGDDEFDFTENQKVEHNELDIDNLIFEDATILIVDDIDLNRNLIKSFLAEQPNLVFFDADDGDQVMDIVQIEKPDIILMDLKMGNISGYEAIEMVRKHGDAGISSIPIVALTASAMKGAEVNVFELGGDGYLVKPVSRKKLIWELARFLPFQQNGAVPVVSAEEAPAQQELDSKIIRLFSTVFTDMEGELMKRWHEIHDKLVFKDIEEFACDIRIIGEQYEIVFLRQWAEGLLKQVKTYNVDKIPKILNEYPEILEKCRKII